MIISAPILPKLHWLPVRQRIHFLILLITYKSINDMAPEYLWCPLESHLENSGHPVRYYCRCQCFGSSHMVIVPLMLQPPFRGIGCRHILEMRRFWKLLKSVLMMMMMMMMMIGVLRPLLFTW